MDRSPHSTGRHLHFSAALAVRLRRALGEYCEQSGVLYAALLEEGGTLCADSGDDSLRDSGETAALAVGAFAALRLVAERLGDDVFEGLLHEGPRRQFSLMPVTARFLLLSVFQAPVRFAVVKICAKNAIGRLRDPLEFLALSGGAPENGAGPPEFPARLADAASSSAEPPGRPVSPPSGPPLPSDTAGAPASAEETGIGAGRTGFDPADWVLGPESHFPRD